MNKKLLNYLLLSLLSIGIVGCNSDGGSGGPGAQNAPGGVAGAGIAFNPTVTFTDGTNFTYENTEVGSPFVQGTINGTYTYTPSGTTAVIVLDAPGSDIGGAGDDTLTINLSNFVGTASAITSFTVEVDGTSFSDGSVVSGTLVPVASASGGGSVPGGDDSTPATINPAFVGTHTLTFMPAFGEPVLPQSPYDEGETVTFEITADGRLIFDGQTLDAPFFFLGNELEVIWFDGTYSYAASGSEVLNEINVAEGFDYRLSQTGGFTFLGQFNDGTGD